MRQLVQHFGVPLVSVAAISSAFSFGRLSTVLLMGWLTEKIGPKRVIAIGAVLILSFLFGLVIAPGIGVAIALGALGGIGMGTQDAAGPVILLRAFPERYASSMGVAQCFFGAGCFVPSVVMGLFLSIGKPYYWMNFALALLCIPLLLCLPFLKWKVTPREKPVQEQKSTAKSSPRSWLFLMLIIIFYCGTVSSVGIYCVSYAVFKGIPESSAVSVLSFYNAGGMIGTMFFAWVLRRLAPSKILYLNFGGALATALSLRVTLWFGAFSAALAIVAVRLYRVNVERKKQ